MPAGLTRGRVFRDPRDIGEVIVFFMGIGLAAGALLGLGYVWYTQRRR